MLRVAGATGLGEKPFDVVARAKAMAMVANLMLSWVLRVQLENNDETPKHKIICVLTLCGHADHTSR